MKTVLKNRSFSRTSVVLCLVYLALTAVCVTWAHITVDLKSYFTLLVIPISLQMALIESMGLMDYLVDISWSLAYFFLVPPMLLLLTGLGNLASTIFKRISVI